MSDHSSTQRECHCQDEHGNVDFDPACPYHGDNGTMIATLPLRVPAEGMSVEDMTLANLEQITENRRLAQASWERAVDAAIAAGIPERKIGKAAGISGPAIHQRKRRQA